LAVGEHNGIDRDGIGFREIPKRTVGREEAIHLFRLRNLDGHQGMGEDESIVTYHDGTEDLFRDPKGLEYRIDDLLIVPAI